MTKRHLGFRSGALVVTVLIVSGLLAFWGAVIIGGPGLLLVLVGMVAFVAARRVAAGMPSRGSERPEDERSWRSRRIGDVDGWLGGSGVDPHR